MTNTNLVQWLASGERGLSSDMMVEHLTGMQTIGRGWRSFGPHHPYDPDDLSRCRKLLRDVPYLGLLFPRMATASPQWAALVGAWDELCALMDAEAPQWSEGHGSAPRTARRMRELLDDAAKSAKRAAPEGHTVSDGTTSKRNG